MMYIKGKDTTPPRQQTNQQFVHIQPDYDRAYPYPPVYYENYIRPFLPPQYHSPRNQHHKGYRHQNQRYEQSFRSPYHRNQNNRIRYKEKEEELPEK